MYLTYILKRDIRSRLEIAKFLDGFDAVKYRDYPFFKVIPYCNTPSSFLGCASDLVSSRDPRSRQRDHRWWGGDQGGPYSGNDHYYDDGNRGRLNCVCSKSRLAPNEKSHHTGIPYWTNFVFQAREFVIFVQNFFSNYFTSVFLIISICLISCKKNSW